ncbi:Ankyrin_repeat protein 3 [Hexamita inflata]|uniref:Ankyrin repeat protein 3 n=1 Tax=Hexamita inflata TaxID=28002 RepID=A0AA86PSH1_9EUKA|nr:Ankyrin repeat protein 3 [Hexamita inflata]
MDLITSPYQFVVLSNYVDDDIRQLITNGKDSNLIVEINSPSLYNLVEYHPPGESVHEITIQIPLQCIKQFICDINNGSQEIGNILCFTSGKEECETICQQLAEQLQTIKLVSCLDFSQYRNITAKEAYEQIRQSLKNRNTTIIIPIFLSGQTPDSDNSIIFKQVPDDLKSQLIKVVICSDTVNSYINIENVVLVIDSGVTTETQWDEGKQCQYIMQKELNLSQRNFRKNLGARTRKGYACVIEMNKLEIQQPEISRQDLKQVILQLKESKINLENIIQTLPSQPKENQIKNALQMLFDLTAIDKQGLITDFGKKLLQYQDINPLISCVFYKLSLSNKKEMAIAIIAYYITSNKSSLIINKFSKVVRECFMEESDAATLVKCYLQIEQQEDKTRAKYCSDNGFNFSVYAEVRIKVYNVINTISKANGDQSFEESEKQENNSVRSTFSKYIISLDSSLILSSLDNFVQLQCAQKLRIDPYCLSQFTFTGLTNLKEDPVYNYECNKVPITCHERPGCTSVSTFSNVFFFDMQFIKSSGLYLGKYMHRILWCPSQL